MPVIKHEPDFAELVDRAASRRNRSTQNWNHEMYELYGAAIDPITAIYRRLTGKLHSSDIAQTMKRKFSRPEIDQATLAALAALSGVANRFQTASQKFKPSEKMLRYSSLAYMLVIGPLMVPRLLVIFFAILTLLFRLSDQRLRDSTAAVANILDLIVNFYFLFEGLLRLFTIPAVSEIRNRHYEADIPLTNSLTYEILRCGWLEILISLLSLAISSQYDSANAICWFNLFRLSFIANFFVLELPQIEVLLSGIYSGFRSIISTWFLLIITFVVYGVLCTAVFRDNDPARFSTVGASMFSLFRISTMDNWSQVNYVNAYGCDAVDSEYETIAKNDTQARYVDVIAGRMYLFLCDSPEQHPYLSSLIFISFVVLTGFMLISLTVAAVSSGVQMRLEQIQKQQCDDDDLYDDDEEPLDSLSDVGDDPSSISKEENHKDTDRATHKATRTHTFYDKGQSGIQFKQRARPQETSALEISTSTQSRAIVTQSSEITPGKIIRMESFVEGQEDDDSDSETKSEVIKCGDSDLPSDIAILQSLSHDTIPHLDKLSHNSSDRSSSQSPVSTSAQHHDSSVVQLTAENIRRHLNDENDYSLSQENDLFLTQYWSEIEGDLKSGVSEVVKRDDPPPENSVTVSQMDRKDSQPQEGSSCASSEVGASVESHIDRQSFGQLALNNIRRLRSDDSELEDSQDVFLPPSFPPTPALSSRSITAADSPPMKMVVSGVDKSRVRRRSKGNVVVTKEKLPLIEDKELIRLMLRQFWSDVEKERERRLKEGTSDDDADSNNITTSGHFPTSPIVSPTIITPKEAVRRLSLAPAPRLSNTSQGNTPRHSFHQDADPNMSGTMNLTKRYAYILKNATATYTYIAYIFLIIVSLAGVEIYCTNKDNCENYVTIFVVIQVLLTIDIMTRIFTHYPAYKTFFHSHHNVFDVALVSIIWFPILGPALPDGPLTSVLRRITESARIVYLLRLLPLLSWISDLQVIMLSIGSSIRPLLYVVMMMFLLFFHFSVAGVLIFKRNDEFYFGTLYRAMNSLFQVATLDNWGDIALKNMYGCDKYGADTGIAGYDAMCSHPQGLGWIAAWYFLIFITLSVMILQSLFVGIIISAMELLQDGVFQEANMWKLIYQKVEKYALQHSTLMNLLDIFNALDVECNGLLTMGEMEPLLKFLPPIANLSSLIAQTGGKAKGCVNFPEFIELIHLIGLKIHVYKPTYHLLKALKKVSPDPGPMVSPPSSTSQLP